LAWAVLGGLLGALAVEFQIARLLELMPLFGDFLRVWRYFIIYWGGTVGLLALLLEVLVTALLGARAVPGRSAATTVLGLTGGSLLAPAWVLARRPFELHDPKIMLLVLAAFLLALLASYLFARIVVRVERGGPWWAAPVVLVLTLAWIGRAFRLPEPQGDPQQIQSCIDETGRRVLLLGIDGANWGVIDPMLARGELPNFRRLIEEGARGTLYSTISPIQPLVNSASSGMRSPVLWTTVITGREPRDHGILDMEVTFVPGLEEPIPFRIPLDSPDLSYLPSNAGMRRVKSLWTILSEQGKRVGSVAWWPSWPMDDVNGFIVSDRYRGEEDGSGRITPLDMVERYRFPELAKAFTIGDVFQLCGGEEMDRSVVPGRVEKLFRMDHLAMIAGPILAEREPWDFLSIYVKSPDVVQHNFWEYHDKGPGLEHRRQIELDYDPVEGVYRYVDDMLGWLLSVLDDNTDLIIISDHGGGPWLTEHGLILDLWKSAERSRWSGNHREDGIFLLWGPDVRAGVELQEPVKLADAAPTALYLMGFPIGEDFSGKPRVDGLDPALVASRPAVYVRSYETELRRGQVYMDPELDSSIEKELRSLGYLN
jgi:predicted AlkP superfamily phosphohydrolase/phosphomutase